MQPSILSGSRAGYVIKFHPEDLPQQNSKTTNTINQYKRGKGKGKTKLIGNDRRSGYKIGVVEAYWNFKRAWWMNDL